MKQPMLIIADDLTGAADTLAAFAVAGWSNRLLFTPPTPERLAEEMHGIAALSLTTDSRDLSPQVAGARVAGAAAPFLENTPMAARPRLYKKIDSTLRGPIGAELSALMQRAACRRVLIAPAFPAQGRTTQNGRQFAHGEELPIDLTALAREACDEHTPLIHLSLGELRAGKAPQIFAAPRGVFLADAQTPEDMALLAAAAQDANFDLLCGSAGLAHALAAPHAPRDVKPNAPEKGGACLMALASRNDVTLRQIDYLCRAGVPCLRLNEANIVQRASQLIRDGQDVVLTTAGMMWAGGDPRAVAASLASLAKRVAQAGPIRRIVATGGDVAIAVCESLGARAIEIEAEIEPGLPLGRLVGGAFEGTPVVTKAGGFGTEESLWHAAGK